MAKKEIKTDYWVNSLLNQANINLEPQGSSILEINEALKSGSKKGTGNVGFPEFVGVVNDFILVIENKADISKHIRLNENGIVSTNQDDVINYAINGAIHYGRHLIKNTTYKKVFAFGVSGNEKNHRITPIYLDETEGYIELKDIESFILFSKENINEYYLREILKEETPKEKETAEILRDASELHEDLRNYGSVQDIDKPLIVSGILLALREQEAKNFSISDLTGDNIKTDGQKIYDAIVSSLQRANVSPETKKDKLLSQFSIIKNTMILNEIHPNLSKTPLKHYTEFLNNNIYKSIRYNKSSEDYLGRFYGEFMSYSGGDGQTLGIVLTPKHITDLFCELININENDVVLDPCCGTGGFLVAAMHHMLEKANSESKKKDIKQKQLHGFELQPYMFTIATTNMILRGDGKSNLKNEDFLKQDTNMLQLKQSTVGLMNPPYSQGSKQNPNLYEISFIYHLLNSLTDGGRCVVIVPQSTMTGKTKEELAVKQNIFKNHTLEGVIDLNKDTFYGVGTMPCIAIFTAGEPHPKDKLCKFINFKDDGFKVSPHIGLIETESAKDKKQHLLDVWFNKIKSPNSFCINTTVDSSDEWLHSFYYFNETLPDNTDFEETVGNYLSFEFNMVMSNKGYLIKDQINKPYKLNLKPIKRIKRNNSIKFSLDGVKWADFFISGSNGVFSIEASSSGIDKNKIKHFNAINNIPYITRTEISNGISDFININQDSKYKINNGNVITIGLDTQTVFYQPHDFYTGQNIQVLSCSNLNKYVALFIIPLLKIQMQKFNWGGNGATLGRLAKTKIMLPIDDSKNPNWRFMENYIKQMYNSKKITYKDSY